MNEPVRPFSVAKIGEISASLHLWHSFNQKSDPRFGCSIHRKQIRIRIAAGAPAQAFLHIQIRKNDVAETACRCKSHWCGWAVDKAPDTSTALQLLYLPLGQGLLCFSKSQELPGKARLCRCSCITATGLNRKVLTETDGFSFYSPTDWPSLLSVPCNLKISPWTHTPAH